jgi:hypothetical protein
MNKTVFIGLGSATPHIHFYIGNRPMIDHYPQLHHRQPLAIGEIAHITKHTSNHWRKVFNVYAKFLFEWYSLQRRANIPDTWQSYREHELFQAHSREALLFSAPDFAQVSNDHFHIVAGKTYAASLRLPSLIWLDAHFAINKACRLIVSPYPDYRQLSNMRIAQLIDIMRSFDS